MTYNSRIKTKWGKCLDCPDGTPDKPLIAKRCPYHHTLHRAAIVKRSTARYAVVNPPPNMAQKELWFQERMEELAFKPFCMECKALIPPEFYRHAVAHIFPKNKFHSVAIHRWNYLFLGSGCGCHDKTHRVDTFCKMKVFPMAVVRFLQFKDEITENHKYLSLFTEQALLIKENEL